MKNDEDLKLEIKKNMLLLLLLLQIEATRLSSKEELKEVIMKSLEYSLYDLDKQISIFERFVDYKMWQEYENSKEYKEQEQKAYEHYLDQRWS